MGIAVSNIKVGWQDYNGYWHYEPNHAGGVSVGWKFQNTGTKSIKYASFFFIPYNSVGDAVGCSITGKSEDGGKFTGPLEPNQITDGIHLENLWYNNSIRSVKITKVYIQYMDGTEETVLGSQVTQISGGTGGSASGCCYVATAVYDSYNCPEVWTLRRYRDYKLAENWYGRAFVRLYYAISPSLVRKFGKTEWFKKMWRGKLDKMVKKLQAEGYESTPYEDKVW